MEYKIAVLKGDGIGPEIVDVTTKVLEKIGEKFNHKFIFTRGYLGGESIDKYGVPLSDETIEICKNSDAVLLGAVGGPKWDKIEAELRDYERLSQIGLMLPKLIYCDKEKEIIIKEFIDGKTIVEIIKDGEFKKDYLKQVMEMQKICRNNNLNIDWYPTNFIVQNGMLYYVDYECNKYMDEWSFENWGIKYWSDTEKFKEAFGKEENA